MLNGAFDISFWLGFIYFLITITVVFFLVGEVLLYEFKLPLLVRIPLSFITGMILWGLQGFIFGFLHIQLLTYVYLFLFLGIWIIFAKRKIIKYIFSFPNTDELLVVIIVIGVIFQLSSVWFSGVKTNKGLFFCCGDISDSLWHSALTNQIVHKFPPQEPGMSGVIVRNYHYLSNIVSAELIRMFHFSLFPLQFQYFGIFLSVFLGLSAISFASILNLPNVYKRWLVFFLYFGGDFIYVLLSISGRYLSFDMSSLEDGVKFLVNPPRAFSIVVLFVGLSLLHLAFVQKKRKYSPIIVGIVIGSIIGMKVYTGIFILFGLGVLTLYLAYERKISEMIIILLCYFVSAVIFLPVNSSSGGIYFTGFWIVENFIVQPRLRLERWELARVIYLEHKNYLRVIQYELMYLFLYIVSIFGSKLLALFQTIKSLSLLPVQMNIILISGTVISLVLGLFFQQASGGSNSFNFLVSVFIIGSIYAALACFYWTRELKPFVKYLVIIIIINLTIPRTVFEFGSNVRRIIQQDGTTITKSQLAAFEFIRNNTPANSLILVDHRRDYFGLDKKSPYIGLFTKRSMFLSGIQILQSHGMDISKREETANEILKDGRLVEVHRNLLKSKVNYIIMQASDMLESTESAMFLQKKYFNDEISIYKVNP